MTQSVNPDLSLSGIRCSDLEGASHEGMCSWLTVMSYVTLYVSPELKLMVKVFSSS